MASTAPSISTSVLLLMSPAFLAVVANTVRQVLLAQQVASLPTCTYSLPASVANSGGISAPPANSSQLAAQAQSFATSGAGFASSPLATPLVSGRPNNCVVPTYVSTFSTPIPSLTHSASPSTRIAALPSSAIGTALLAPLTILHQPFVLGPGFSPVLAKLVSQMVARKFIELHELLPSNIVLTESEPQLLFDVCLVLTSPPKNLSSALKIFLPGWRPSPFTVLSSCCTFLTYGKTPTVSTLDSPNILSVLRSGLVVLQLNV